MYLPDILPTALVSCWRPSGNPFPLYLYKRKKVKILQPVSVVFFDVCRSVCVYALRQAAGCVEAGPEPAASQQDRRGSRWICLDLTLPTPLHPTGPPLPTCTSLCSVKSSSREGEFVLGGWAVYVMLLVPSRESRKRDRNQAAHKRETLSLQTFPHRPLVCWHMAPVSMLELLVGSVPLLCLFCSLSGTLCFLLPQPNPRFACLFRECFAFFFFDIESPLAVCFSPSSS